MPDLNIAVILGSTRPGRNGKSVADWVTDKAAGRSAANYELVDLADYPLPHMDEAIPPSVGQYAGIPSSGRRRSAPTTVSSS
jgi:NAD(P)H-dependent FMN reductase